MSLVDVDYDLDLELTRGRMDGSLLRSKARMLLDALGIPALADIFTDAKAGHGARMDAAKILMELGDMKPKPQAPQTSGPPLQISINLPAGTLTQPGSHNPRQLAPESPTLVIDMTPTIRADELAEMPQYLRVPDFKLTPDLVGPSLHVLQP